MNELISELLAKISYTALHDAQYVLTHQANGFYLDEYYEEEAPWLSPARQARWDRLCWCREEPIRRYAEKQRAKERLAEKERSENLEAAIILQKSRNFPPQTSRLENLAYSWQRYVAVQ